MDSIDSINNINVIMVVAEYFFLLHWYSVPLQLLLKFSNIIDILHFTRF